VLALVQFEADFERIVQRGDLLQRSAAMVSLPIGRLAHFIMQRNQLLGIARRAEHK
jgi:hypothetical protein